MKAPVAALQVRRHKGVAMTRTPKSKASRTGTVWKPQRRASSDALNEWLAHRERNFRPVRRAY
jgi:hypothetical protein